jgi:VIT1/CCC1 family predicted Fe2+/Mn2+ transporter
LEAADVGLGDHAGAEGVAQVVEAQLAEAGGNQGDLVAAAQRGGVEVVAALAGEDEVVIADSVLPAAKLRQRRRDVGRERHRTNLAGLGSRQMAVVEG